MIKSIKNAYIVLKENMMLLQPLILFSLLIGFVAAPIKYSLHQTIPSLIAIFTSTMSFVAFYAGWAYMLKLAVEKKDVVYATPEEKGLAQIDLLKKFFTGVGEYFLPALGILILYLLTFVGLFYIAYKIGIETISPFDLLNDLPKYLSMDTTQLYKSITAQNASITSQLVFIKWSLLFFVAGIFHSFLTLFFMPILMFKTKNPLKAFVDNIVFIFKYFIEVCGLLLFLTILYMLFSLISAPANTNIIFAILSLFIMFFYATYHVVLLFVYYDSKNESSSDSRTDSIG